METISSILESRLRAALTEFGDADAHVQTVADARFGDYQTNAAMTLAKKQKANPRELAQRIASKIEVSDLCLPPEIAGPGFINFRLKPEWLAQRFVEFARDEKLGTPMPAKPRKIVVDFSSPNVAKPMHVGHIRSTILGDALARIAEFVGHDVVRDNHIGDWGTQFGMLLLGWKTELNREALAVDALGEMERMYKLVSARYKEDAETQKAAQRELVLLQSGDPENLGLWQEMIRLSQHQFDAIYQRLDIRFDVVYGESFYNSRLKGVVDELKAAGIASESEGALCVFSDGSVPAEQDPFQIKDKDGWRPNPAMILKSDGASNYTTTDLATLQFRVETWNPDEILYVTDGRQQLHFRQFFSIFGRWHPECRVKLAHVWFGSILGDDGKPFKTRSGETVKLAELLDEAEERALVIVKTKNAEMPEGEQREIARVIGVGSVKYADLLPNRQSDYTFSWDKMLALQGNTAPYLMNAAVRIAAIFRKAEGETGVAENGVPSADFALVEAAELALLKKLYLFAEALLQVLEDDRPNLLCNYLFELASTFHSFFEACPVLRAKTPALRASRLALCHATGRVLKTGLGLLGIAVPERM